MRIFIDGTPRNNLEFFNELSTLHNDYAGISEVIVCAFSPVAELVLDWAKEYGIKSCVYLSKSGAPEDIMLTSIEIIHEEAPNCVILLGHSDSSIESISEEVCGNPNVQVLMVRD